MQNKRGGSRKGAGCKPKYSEKTKTITFRVPESKVGELKALIKEKLSTWTIK